MRLNARLTKIQARHLDELTAATGESLSEVVRAAIDCYHAQVIARPSGPASALRTTGFVGCGEADDDLSTGYRRVWAEGLERKHGHR